MPRQTKSEHDAALASAKADGAAQASKLTRTLAEQEIDLQVILGALAGLVNQLSDEAEKLTEAAKRPAG